MRLKASILGLVVLLVALTLGALSLRGDDAIHWSPDGFIYARMMLMDRGYSASAADATARAFYMKKPVAVSGAALFQANPPNFWKQQPALFRGRLVYPYVASLLYPRFGFSALHVVSAVSYVCAVLLMYLFLLRFAPAPFAAIGAVIFASMDTVNFLAGSDSTDELAFFLWIASVVVMIGFVQARRSWWLALFTALCFILVFTRPIIFLSLGAALGVLVFGAVTRDKKNVAAGALLSLPVVLAGIAYLAARFPGAMEQLQWHYHWQIETNQWPQTSFLAFYAYYVTHAIVYEGHHLFADGLMLIIVIAAIALYLNRREPFVSVFVGSCVGALAVFFVNPHNADLQRAFELPLTPALIVGFVLAMKKLLQPPPPAMDAPVATAPT